MGPEEPLQGAAIFLKLAEQCERLAASCQSSFYREALLDTATQWRKMAEQSEAEPASPSEQVSSPSDIR
jgi:hypothetical protein